MKMNDEMVSVEMTSDIQVRDNVFREMRLDSRVKGKDIEVTVKDGTVTLAGTVASTTEELAALEVARRADKVFEVINDIKVRSPRTARTDTDIAKAVQHTLEWDTLIPDRRIQVAVSNGWVALQGRVDLLHERDDAERSVRRLEGVRGVYNMLEVNPPEARTENVRETIEEALRQCAEREADGIQVSLREGAVDLSGKVHTWAEKQLILGALSHAPGVEKINDHLSIDPYF